MSMKDSSLNDLMTQCSKKLIKTSEKEEKDRIDEINKCNHLFVKLRDYDRSVIPSVDLSIVECVHCGVTNKYVDLEKTMLRYRKSLEYYVMTRFHNFNVEYNNMTIETAMMNEISKEYVKDNLMSNRILRSFHPGVLYDIAKFINPDGDNEELFEIMFELNNLETSEEKNRLSNIFDAKDLIERYFTTQEEKIYIKK